jgi:alkanesulfonate monooxygenase SsuD/methylene tetrahydromethanopterin reductase-like flavin-dependent oxidoreductase (luciferase family)
VQKPHPPIYLAAFAPAALKRLARMANGWNPVGIPVEGMAQMFAGIQQMAKEAGRDPASLDLIVRGNLHITDKPLPAGRFIFGGTLEQIGEDIAACSKIGAHETILDPTFSPNGQNLETWLSLMEKLRKLA